MPSSPTSLVSAQSGAARRDHLLDLLAGVSDPRDPRGVRYPLGGMLAVALTAVMSGARSFTAIGEAGADLPAAALDQLGLSRAPVESTVRKLFARIDAEELDRQVTAFAWTRSGQIAGRRVVAIDGKTLRGARRAGGQLPHLIAGLDHATGTVIAQREVEAKSNEIPAVRDLLSAFDLTGAVVTVDAMHTQRATAEVIVDGGADYVFTVKGNQPLLHAGLKALPWKDVPAHRHTQRGHGRTATRTI